MLGSYPRNEGNHDASKFIVNAALLYLANHSQGCEQYLRISRELITRSDVVLTLPHDTQTRSRVTNPSVFIVRETVGNIAPHAPHLRPTPGSWNSFIGVPPVVRTS